MALRESFSEVGVRPSKRLSEEARWLKGSRGFLGARSNLLEFAIGAGRSAFHISSVVSRGRQRRRAGHARMIPVRHSTDGVFVLSRLVYELVDAHSDTAQLADDFRDDLAWAAHLDYLRGLQRVARETLALMSLSDRDRPISERHLPARSDASSLHVVERPQRPLTALRFPSPPYEEPRVRGAPPDRDPA